jgi:sec-independent protein translocase protein TatC
MNEDEKQPFLSHLEELRKRLVAISIGIGVGFVVCYIFSDQLFKLLVLPLRSALPKGDTLIFTNLPEMFITYLKVSLIAGVLLASPFIFYQLWLFIAPGLYRHEKRYILPFVIFSTILFVGGALFGYFVVFPFGFKFFIGFSNEYVKALPSVKQYFSFSIKLLFAFGLVFELPLVVFFLAKMGLITPEFLKKQRKYAILIIFIVAAILTPPDAATQIMMAVPLLILYEIGIIVAKMARKKDVEKVENDDEAET